MCTAMTTNELIAAMSNWLDDGNRGLHPMHLLRIRTDKLIEEVGEVQEVIIGLEGSNPRKGYYGSEEDLTKELLDVATTALYAFIHVTRSDDVIAEVEQHIRGHAVRAGIYDPTL